MRHFSRIKTPMMLSIFSAQKVFAKSKLFDFLTELKKKEVGPKSRVKKFPFITIDNFSHHFQVNLNHVSQISKQLWLSISVEQLLRNIQISSNKRKLQTNSLTYAKNEVPIKCSFFQKNERNWGCNLRITWL